VVGLRAIGRSKGPRTGRPSASVRPSALSVGLVGLLLTFTLVATSFDLHPHANHDADQPHATGADHGDLPVFSGASHPHQAPHVETSGQVVSFHCPVCLLHFQSLGDADRHAPGARVPAATGRVSAASTHLRRAPIRHAGGSRAPPFSV